MKYLLRKKYNNYTIIQLYKILYKLYKKYILQNCLIKENFVYNIIQCK